MISIVFNLEQDFIIYVNTSVTANRKDLTVMTVKAQNDLVYMNSIALISWFSLLPH